MWTPKLWQRFTLTICCTVHNAKHSNSKYFPRHFAHSSHNSRFSRRLSCKPKSKTSSTLWKVDVSEMLAYVPWFVALSEMHHVVVPTSIDGIIQNKTRQKQILLMPHKPIQLTAVNVVIDSFTNARAQVCHFWKFCTPQRSDEPQLRRSGCKSLPSHTRNFRSTEPDYWTKTGSFSWLAQSQWWHRNSILIEFNWD